MSLNLIQKFNAESIKSECYENREVDSFKSGDTLCIHVKIFDKSGEGFKVKKFQGVCIATKFSNNNISSNFIVRKVTKDVSIEKRFFLFSKEIHKIERINKGIVRRSKLYYLRNKIGKKARIKVDNSR